MTLWRSFLLHLFWCCATIAGLVLSQGIYPWIWIWEMRNAPSPAYSRLLPLDEQCARDGPYRSMLPNSERDCDRWEKWKARSGQ